MEKTTFLDWIKSKLNKSRYELEYMATDIMLENNNIVSADVYDDYLLFNVINGQNLGEHKTIYMILIDDFNQCNITEFANLIERKADEIKF